MTLFVHFRQLEIVGQTVFPFTLGRSELGICLGSGIDNFLVDHKLVSIKELLPDVSLGLDLIW